MSAGRPLAALAAALALVPLAAGCGGRDALTIYSGRGENLVGPLLERFAENRDVPVDIRYGDSADLALLIAEEGDRTPADVFLSQSPGAVGFLTERDLLQPLDPALLERVDPLFRSDQGLWVGLTGRQRVLVYNEELVSRDELPRSVLDLTEEPFRGRVGLAPPNASFQDFVSIMRQDLGDERTRAWLEGMAANDVETFPNNNAIVDAVARGEIPFGLANHYYNERFLAEDPSLPSRNHAFPAGDVGSVVLVSTASVLAGSDDPRAQQFVELLLSREAQEFFRDETFEYPLAAGVDPAPGLPPLDVSELRGYSIEELGDELRTTVEMIGQAGLSE